MRRKIVLAVTAIGMSLMFNGCATALQDNVQGVLNTLDAPFVPIAKALDSSYDATFGANSLSKSTDNLEPWNIKSSEDTHYMLDAFYALPTAKSKDEAKRQIKEVLSSISIAFKRWGNAENNRLMPLRSRNGMCDWVYKTDIKDGVFAYIKEVEPSCGSGGTYRYIGFVPKKINGIYYMVVGNTNAKNNSIFSSFHDAAITVNQNGYNQNGFITPEYNSQISYTVTALIDKIAKVKNQLDKYVNIQLDSKNPYARKYRDNFSDYFKKALK
jgi:hypothetical protein